jgi:nucleotidyltransferase substrate binding protein (TIGR01987 family)
MKEFLVSLENSIKRLKDILKKKKTVANRDSAIKRFELTIELTWKTTQRFLREQNIICRSPKECLQEAFRFGLIDDDARWLEALEDRNLTVHTYNEKTADEVYKRLPRYLNLFSRLEKELKKHALNLRPRK